MTKGQIANIFDYMTDAQIAGVQAHTYDTATLGSLGDVFQAAFDAKPQALFIPRGLYPIDKSVTVTAECHIYSDSYKFDSLYEGTTLYGTGAFNLLNVQARDVMIERLRFAGLTSTNASTSYIYPTIANVGETYTYNLRIRDCYFYGGVRQIVASYNPNQLNIRDCQFQVTSDTVACIEIVQNTGLGTNPVETTVDKCVFSLGSGQTFNANAAAMVFDSVDTHNVTRCQVQGNFKYAVDVQHHQTYANNLIRIENNNFEDIAYIPIRTVDAKNTWITSNEIVGQIGAGATCLYGIYGDNLDFAFIDNNILSGFQQDGIFVFGGAIRLNIVNNKINDVGLAATNTYYNINMFNCGTSTVVGNKLAGNDNQANVPKAYILLNGCTEVTTSGNSYHAGSYGTSIIEISGGSTLLNLYDNGGVTNKGLFVTSGLPGIIYGAGTPEGAVVANVGSIYMRTDGGAGTSMYVKESGASNTGWVGK